MRVGWKHCRFKSIQLTWIVLNRRELFPLLSIQHVRSRFVRDLENIALLDNLGWVKNVVDSTRFQSNQHKSYELTEVCGHILRTGKVHVSLFHGSWLLLDYAGWVENVVDSIQSNQHESFPLLSIRHARSRFVCQVVKCLRRIDSVWVYWTWMKTFTILTSSETVIIPQRVILTPCTLFDRTHKPSRIRNL